MLAVALCPTEMQNRYPHDRLVSSMSAELWEWLETRTANSGGHPNIDYEWKSQRVLQAALRRLEKRRLLRASCSPWSSAMLWRPTEAAGRFLADRRLFADAA